MQGGSKLKAKLNNKQSEIQRLDRSIYLILSRVTLTCFLIEILVYTFQYYIET